jgi:transposase-like protein
MEVGFSEELKARQQYWLEHLRSACSQGVTLAEYARVAQVDSDALYRWRALFKRKGVPVSAAAASSVIGFSAVRIAGSADAQRAVTVRVGAGVQVQCVSLPSPQWLAELSRCLQESR